MTTATATNINTPLDAYNRALQFHPTATPEQLLQLAKFLAGESAGLDHDKVTAAAVVLARADGAIFNRCEFETQSKYVGLAAATVVAYRSA